MKNSSIHPFTIEYWYADQDFVNSVLFLGCIKEDLAPNELNYLNPLRKVSTDNGEIRLPSRRQLGDGIGWLTDLEVNLGNSIEVRSLIGDSSDIIIEEIGTFRVGNGYFLVP